MELTLLKQKSKEELIALAITLEAELKTKQQEVIKQAVKIEQLNLFRNEKFGNKSEKAKDLAILDEAGATPEENIEEAEEIIVSAHTRKKGNGNNKPGRKPLPDNLPRETRIYDLAEGEKICSCGHQLTCIGEEVTEQLEIEPAKLYVIVHVAKNMRVEAVKKELNKPLNQNSPYLKG